MSAPYSFNFTSELIVKLFEGAALAARLAARQGKRALSRRKRGLTLKPGMETPLWNELVAATKPFLHKRGSKAQLARLLGVPRQKLQTCLKQRHACLDAERALLLLCWVTARQQGRELMA